LRSIEIGPVRKCYRRVSVAVHRGLQQLLSVMRFDLRIYALEFPISEFRRWSK
jgi:hypothetical protein